MTGLFIDGAWQDAAAGGIREIRCPADGSLVATVPEGGPEDSERAIEAARRAFDSGPWSSTSSLERSALLHRLADLLERDKAEVAQLESLDTGKRLIESEYDVDDIVGVFRHFAGLAGAESGRVVDTGRANVVSRVVHEPVGVCSLITPWNYPLLQTAWKVAPALAAGNTFVLKPSELTPSTAIWLMRSLAEAGLPPGVANLVLGAGAKVGA
ncbi:MAG: aldehyde dehydrogenase family protein, partial [Aeromicrobium sp.]